MITPSDSFSVPEDLIAPLLSLYTFESEAVNQSMHVGRSFSVSWTRDELDEILERDGFENGISEKLFKELRDTGRIVPLFGSEESEEYHTKYRTDTAELVRLSTFNYNRYAPSDGPLAPTQAGVTWSIEQKRTPVWSISSSEATEIMVSEIDSGWEDDNGSQKEYENQSELKQAVKIVMDAYDFSHSGNGMLSGFQFRSVRSTIRGLYSGGEDTMAIVAGTGSGKSYGFQLGALIGIVERRISGNLDWVHSIFLYPRVALMVDQRKSMEEVLLPAINSSLGSEGLEGINWITDGGSRLAKEYQRITGNEKARTADMIREVYGKKENCPHLLFANPDTLTYRLMDPIANSRITESLRNVVFDEVHLLSSITGASTSGVIRRLCSLSVDGVMFTGSSATVADEKDHISRVTGRATGGIITHEPDKDTELELTGIIHHVIHRGAEGHNFMSNLTNLTSIVTHGRRRRKESPVDSPSDSHKTLGFADSLSILGQWEYLVRDNEGLELTKAMRGRANTVGTDASNLLPKQIPLPYRFNRPLVNLARSGADGVPDIESCEDHCKKCISGEESWLPVSNGSELNSFRLDHFRADSDTELSGWDLDESPVNIGVTDGCPYFRLGACWREEESFEPISLFPEGPVVFKSSIHPVRLTADSIRRRQDESESEVDHFIVDLVDFHGLKDSARDRFADNSHGIADIALSSPSIEVGMDFDNALDAVLFKAIRNTSAYRQKVGRLGRERFRDVYASMLTSFRAVDYHYYRNPSPLLSNDRLEPIPLASDNRNVRMQTAFLAVFDDIARFGSSAANTIYSFQLADCYKDVVLEALEHLEGGDVARRLNQNLERDLEICNEAVKQAREILNLLVEDNSELLSHGATCLADRIGRGSNHGRVGGIVGPPTQTRVSRIHQLWLSERGEKYSEYCVKLRDLLSDMASCLDTAMEVDERLGEFFQQGTDIWVQIEKGGKSSGVEEFVETLSAEEFRNLFILAIQSGDYRLTEVLNEAIQFSMSLENLEDPVKQKITHGDIALGISLRDWNSEARKFPGEGANALSWYFLRDLLGGLHITRHRHPFVFQKSLFEAPNEEKTKLIIPRRGMLESEDSRPKTVEIPMREAIFAHGPGMFSYRREDSPMKTKCYVHLIPTSEDGVLTLPLNDLPGSDREVIKHRFSPQGEIPADQNHWGVASQIKDKTVKLYRPNRLNLWFNKGPDRGNKVILSDNIPGAVADKDDCPDDRREESPEDAEEKERPKNIPECFPIQWRSLVGHSPTPVLPFDGGLGKVFSGDPLKDILFKEVTFDEAVTAKEFSMGLTRKYQGGGEATILYTSDPGQAEHYGNPAAMGYEFGTEGISFSISEEALESAAEWARERVTSVGGGEVCYLVLQHILSDAFNQSRFAVDSLLRLALHSKESGVPNSLGDWIDLIMGLGNDDLVNFTEEWEQTTSKHISLESLEEMVRVIENSPPNLDVEEGVDDWAIRCFGNSLGIHLMQAGREHTGSRDDDLGYHVTIGSEKAKPSSDVNVWLYDRSPDGNGTCRTIDQWFSIPSEVRQVIEDPTSSLRNLPTKDFMQTLSDYLKPCDGHQARIVAKGLHKIGKDASGLTHRLLRDVDFDYSSYHNDWESMEQDYPDFCEDDYVFLRLMIPLIERDEVKRERTNKAASSCGSSCVQCLEEFGISMLGPLQGPLYANKRVLDHVISKGMRARPDVFRVNDMTLDGAARGISGIGSEDHENPLEITTGPHMGTYTPMSHPERMWAEIDPDDPVSDDGELNVISWTKMRHPRWG